MKYYNLTFCDKLNYGAMLQCYSLQKMCEKLGCEIVHLNFKEKLSFKSFIKSMFPRKRKMIHNSKIFIEDYIRSKLITNNLETTLSLERDEIVLLVGSDQVWNPLIDNNSFLCKFSFPHVRKRSYACSLGIFKKDEKMCNLIPFLEDFENVSVREIDAYEYFKKISKLKKVSCDLDPTLLVESSFWKEMAIDKHISIPEHFILVFGIFWLDKYNEELEKIHKETGVSIISISESKRIFCTKNMYGVSPLFFLTLFLRADYVITSSYHGTCFSIIFEKPFCALINPNAPSRITCLLETLDLKDRIFDVPVLNFECSFEHSSRRLNELRKDSLSVLKDAISK